MGLIIILMSGYVLAARVASTLNAMVSNGTCGNGLHMLQLLFQTEREHRAVRATRQTVNACLEEGSTLPQGQVTKPCYASLGQKSEPEHLPPRGGVWDRWV